MFTRLRLKNFKSFKELDVRFGSLNILIGANASGISNLREVFRFLHGVGRGYSLIEILGEKWGQGGDLLWTGIRGGPSAVAFWGERVFEIEVEFPISSDEGASYLIAVDTDRKAGGRLPPKRRKPLIPRIVRERLTVGGRTVFEVLDRPDIEQLKVSVWQKEKGRNPSSSFLSSKPVLSQLVEKSDDPELRDIVKRSYSELVAIRFLEPQPEAIRRPCFPGTPLGEHGENLAAALYALRDANKIGIFNEFLSALTPADIEGLVFSSDTNGRLELILQEAGREISLASVSDGTLRFMTLLTLLMTENKSIYLEEIETGLHPSRLSLLLEILQQSAKSHQNQIFATSHSPQLLALMGEKSAEYGYLAIRTEEAGASTLLPLSELPDGASGVLKEQDPGELHTSGWFEDIGYFTGVGS